MAVGPRRMHLLAPLAAAGFALAAAGAWAQSPDGGDPGGPRCFWASQPVGPDETVLAATGNTDAASTVEVARLADEDPGEPDAAPSRLQWQAARVVQASRTAVKFLIPADWRAGVYAFRITSGGRKSPVTLLNAPDPWFIQGDRGATALPGGWLQVHGTAIGSAAAPSRLALSRDGKLVAVLTAAPGANGYMRRFGVPAKLPPGEYQVHVHNGLGGPGAWTRFHSFIETAVDSVSIVALKPWPAQVVDVSRQAGGNDDERFGAAIGALAAQGGGVLLVPAGSYALTRQLALPNRTVLRGQGRERSIIHWTASPTDGAAAGARQIALVTGAPLARGRPERGSFAIEDVALVGAPDFVYHAVESVFTTDHGGVIRSSIVLPNLGEFDSKSDLHATAIMLRHSSGFEVVDSELDAANDIFARENVSFVRIENNRLDWTEGNLWISGRSHNFIVAGNTFNLRGTADSDGWTAVASRQRGTNPNPGFWFTAFFGTNLPGTSMGGPYTRDLYYANNRSTRDKPDLPPFYVGLTYDGGDGIFLGKVASVDGTTLHLDGTTLQPRNNGQYDWSGGIAQIVDGRGAGQWRYLVHAGSGESAVEVDRPWDVDPDAGSTVSLVNLQGRVLMVDNDFAQEQTNQQYFFTVDVIKAYNTYGVDGAKASDLSWLGKHYGSLSPGWHLQLLDNQVVRGLGMTFKSGVFSRTDGYAGPGGGYQVFRNNRSTGKAGPFALSITSKNGHYVDAVVEHNGTDTIDLGPKPDDPIDVSGILLRGNAGSLAGNVARMGPGDDSIVRVVH